MSKPSEVFESDEDKLYKIIYDPAVKEALDSAFLDELEYGRSVVKIDDNGIEHIPFWKSFVKASITKIINEEK